MGRAIRIGVRAIGAALGVAAILLAAVLAEAHWEIRGIEPPLPDPGEIAALRDAPDGPVRFDFVNTASQAGPDVAVGHPVFRIDWGDRAFLLDAGMEREQALAFGELIEWLLDADPIEPHGSLVEQLGPDVRHVAGIGLTHLHPDHTGGLPGLCRALGRPLPVFQTLAQAERVNYSTAAGRELLDAADCLRRERLAETPLAPVPGFPGLFAVAAGGHTPGSTVFVARVDGHTWVLAGDVTNSFQELRQDRPKPWLYSLLVTPEHRERLAVLRAWLRELDALPKVSVLVPHDVDALHAAGVPLAPRPGA